MAENCWKNLNWKKIFEQKRIVFVLLSLINEIVIANRIFHRRQLHFQYEHLLRKSLDWFLYDKDLRIKKLIIKKSKRLMYV